MWIDDASALLSDFINTINDKKNILRINKDHLNSLSIVDACIKSSKNGKKISIKNYWILLLFCTMNHIRMTYSHHLND